jgi:hypothetical protein
MSNQDLKNLLKDYERNVYLKAENEKRKGLENPVAKEVEMQDYMKKYQAF